MKAQRLLSRRPAHRQVLQSPPEQVEHAEASAFAEELPARERAKKLDTRRVSLSDEQFGQLNPSPSPPIFVRTSNLLSQLWHLYS
jgi:hypothetical protein